MTRRSGRSVDKLVKELLSLSTRDADLRIANDSRFHSLEVARRLTELSAAALPERPEDSAWLASTALVLLDYLPSDAINDAAAVRAYCALSNARRIEGNLEEARAELDFAAELVTFKDESALHLRSYALLRWEQGRCDEAIGLLHRAERLFRDSDLASEASAAAQLLILFYAEMGDAANAIAIFRSLGFVADSKGLPWLGARAALTAAFLLAHPQDLASPEEALTALALGGSLIPLVDNPDELLRLEWLQARARARMGHHEEAASTLLSLRQRLCPPGIGDLNFHLLALDLFALRVTAGQDIEDLLEELDTTPPSIPELPPLSAPLRYWFRLAKRFFQRHDRSLEAGKLTASPSPADLPHKWTSDRATAVPMTCNMNAEALLQELAGSTCQVQQFLSADPRFHRPDLLELLLAQSQDAQLASPDKAARLAGLAISIAERIQDDPDTTRSTLVRARCLSANSFRLARLFDLASDALSKTVPLLDPMPRYDESHRALFCRTLGLVRWDQGRLDEALSLLRQAWRLFEDAKEPSEWQTCTLLLALLYDEMGLPDGVTAAMGSFIHGWFEPSHRPWLTSRALLTFAAEARPEHRLAALFALDEGVRFQGCVSDSNEQLHLFALEGRARARLGFLDEASQMIEAVRRRHLEAGSMIELTLSTLDLLAFRVASELPACIDDLLGDIESLGYTPQTTSELASKALDRFVSWVAGDEAPWTSRRIAATWYLQAHRFAGIGLSPLPFA